jgi:hypothetical protein
MRIYVAGPYSKGDIAMNVRTAIHVGDYIAGLGHYPLIPHLTHFWHMVVPHPYEFWIKQDLVWLEMCDAILRISGESAGADRKIERAMALRLTIYNSVFEIPMVDDENHKALA